jgi:dipeptidyl aminopeptidase/acylaminoacyl peptidase
MSRLFRAAAAALACLVTPFASQARPFTVDDLLHEQSFGAAAFDSSGRWLVFEQRDPYDTAKRYDYFSGMGVVLSRLRLIDMRHATASRPLLTPDPGPGVVMGSFSPTGDRLAVYRVQDRRWTLGVATVATGKVRWFDVTPQEAARGRTIQWLTDKDLLVIDRPDGALPINLRTGWILGDRLPKALEAAARGAGAHTIMGSGAYAAVRLRGAPNRLLRLDTETGQRHTLATGEFIDLEISPDQRRVALFGSGPDLQAHGNAPVRGAAGLETEATRLSIVDLASGRQTSPCPRCDLFPDLLSWSPSGHALMVLARGAEGLWTSGALLKVDAVSGEHPSVSAGFTLSADARTLAMWTGWMGEDPLAFGHLQASGDVRQDWYRMTAAGPIDLTAALEVPERTLRISDGQTLTVLAKGGAWRVDGRGQVLGRVADRVTALVLGDLRASTGARLAHAPEAAPVVLSGAAEARRVGDLDRLGLHPRLALPAGRLDLVATASDGSLALTHDTDAHGVERLRLLRPDAPPRVVAALNTGFAEIDAPIVVPVHHLGLQGRSLVSWLYLPPGRAGERLPVIVRPYLGDTYPTAPGDYPLQAGFYQNLRMLTAHGYAVLLPSLPNPPEGMTDPGARLAERILDVLQAALTDATVGARLDPDRVALSGWSFGGYTVMETITQTNRFRAAVEMDGISDFTAYWAALPMSRQINPEMGYMSNWHTGGVETAQPKLLAPPWVDRDRYVRNSPIYAADKIETPLLLIHGAMDVLPIAQSEAMYSALFRQGKDALLVTYWGAVHEPTAPGDVRDLYQRTFQFLDEHLAPRVSRAGVARAANPGAGPASDAPKPPP